MHGRGALRWALAAGALAVSLPARADAPKPIDVKNLDCQGFLAQPDDVRPMLVAWVHGYTHAGGGNWVLDPAAARTFVTSVQGRCEKAPGASFRYQVLEVAKQRQAEQKKAKAAESK